MIQPRAEAEIAFILKEDIFLQLSVARANIREIQNLDKNAFFNHPLFGNINKKRVLLFLNAHTNHHLKIVLLLVRVWVEHYNRT